MGKQGHDIAIGQGWLHTKVLVEGVNVLEKLPQVLAKGVDQRHVALLLKRLELHATHAAEHIVDCDLHHLRRR